MRTVEKDPSRPRPRGPGRRGCRCRRAAGPDVEAPAVRGGLAASTKLRGRPGGNTRSGHGRPGGLSVVLRGWAAGVFDSRRRAMSYRRGTKRAAARRTEFACCNHHCGHRATTPYLSPALATAFISSSAARRVALKSLGLAFDNDLFKDTCYGDRGYGISRDTPGQYAHRVLPAHHLLFAYP